jgi:hypothetical protein
MRESPIPPDKSHVHGLAWNRFPIGSEITITGENGLWKVQSMFQNENNELVITAQPQAHPDHPGVPQTVLASTCHPTKGESPG